MVGVVIGDWSFNPSAWRVDLTSLFFFSCDFLFKIFLGALLHHSAMFLDGVIAGWFGFAQIAHKSIVARNQLCRDKLIKSSLAMGFALPIPKTFAS